MSLVMLYIKAIEEASRYKYSSSSNHLFSLSNDLQQTYNRKSLSSVNSHVSHCISCVLKDDNWSIKKKLKDDNCILLTLREWEMMQNITTS